ncbi:PLDc N-terminal domain-containing protein, partial [Brevibacterium sandarakinum]
MYVDYSVVASVLGASWIVIEYVVKIIAVGVVPEDRRPSSSSAWLLLILFVPIVGIPLFLMLGSP